MLSYNTPVAMNGQLHSATANLDSAAKAVVNHAATITTTDAAHASSATAQLQRQSDKKHHIWLVTGPAGCGKSTIGKSLSASLELPFIEGDEYHPTSNVEKMSHGIPLTDADRWDWLTLLREVSLRKLAEGADGVVLTCSALKRKYRDVIRVAPYYSHGVVLHFIYLHAPEDVLLERVGHRQGHFMGANMVHSQFTILEPPTPEEMDVISVDVSGTPSEVEREVLDRVIKKIDESVNL